MNPTITDNSQYLALEGPLGLSAVILLAIALLGLFGWALWRERRVLGQRTAILFWALRAVAVATVLWMLLAPMNVTVETSTTRRAIAIAADISGSMQTIDPAGTSDDLRWSVAAIAAEDAAPSPTAAADKAIAAMGMAQRHLDDAIHALDRHLPETTVVEATTSANAAIKRVHSHLQQVEGAGHSVDQSHSLMRQVISLLEEAEFEDFDHLATALEKGRTPSQMGWRESLPDLAHRMQTVRRSLSELARQLATADASQIAQSSPAQLMSIAASSRVSRVAGLLDQLQESTLEPLRETADVRVSAFDSSLTLLGNQQTPGQSLTSLVAPESASADQTDEEKVTPNGTDISAVLEELNRQRQEQPLAAVVLLTDVAHNQPVATGPREMATTLGDTPIYVVPVGNTKHVRDVILQSVYGPAVAMRNDDIVIEASLQAHDCEGEVCVVQLLEDGDVVDFREVTLDSSFASRTIRFERQMPTIGVQQFQVAVTPLDGELTDVNNYDELDVNVTRSDIKVLLADELPRWEYRYLAQLFRRDSKVECDELLYHPRLIATGRRAETKTVPITIDDWNYYDIVMLGDLPPEHLPVAAQESLLEYVQKRGGTLVILAGRGAMPQAFADHPLQEILPVQPLTDSQPGGSSGYAFRVTDEGRDHHALMIGESEQATRTAWDFINRYSPLHEVSNWRQPRPSTHTLIAAIPRDSLDEAADAAESAFLCWQPVGRGKVVYLSGPETYRLRFLRGDQLHYRFWGQLLRWAIAADLSAGSEFVRIRLDKSRYRTREVPQVRVQLQDAESQPVMVEGLEASVTAGETQQTVPLVAVSGIPGAYTAEIRALTPGVYRVEPIGTAVDELQNLTELEAPSASFTVQADLPLELVDTRSNRALAQQLADVTGGQVLPPTAVAEILKLTSVEPIVTETVQRRPLWLEWKYLWIVFGCLQTEWIVRKWRGLS